MIIGVGTDMVNIDRIKSLYDKSGDAFMDRILCEEEKKQATLLKEKSSEKFYHYIAKRFAAKEALSKALGTGIGKSMSFTDVAVCNDDSGKPVVKMGGDAEMTLEKVTPENMVSKIDISLSDEPPLACAFVVISVY